MIASLDVAVVPFAAGWAVVGVELAVLDERVAPPVSVELTDGGLAVRERALLRA
jgi:hypothetical protein